MSNENENKIVPDEQAEAALEAAGDELPAATEKAVEHDSYQPSPARAAAHLIGISTPEDEHHTSYADKARDSLSDEELLAMGVEPDGGPTRNMVLTFAAMVVLIIGVGIAVAQLFNVVNQNAQARSNARVDARLAELQEAAREMNGSYEALEGGTYRVPVETGMDILRNDPSLLARHPLAPEPTPEPPAVAPTEQPAGAAPEGSGEAAAPADAAAADSAAAVDPHAGHNHAAGGH